MAITRKEAIRLNHQADILVSLGFSYAEAESLRRISVRLHGWFEKECGTDNGCIERDEETGKTYWLNAFTGRRFPVRDLETGARKRLAAIMANHAPLTAYIQGDCRGATLYIIRPGDVPAGESVDSFYNRGIVVY